MNLLNFNGYGAPKVAMIVRSSTSRAFDDLTIIATILNR